MFKPVIGKLSSHSARHCHRNLAGVLFKTNHFFGNNRLTMCCQEQQQQQLRNTSMDIFSKINQKSKGVMTGSKQHQTMEDGNSQQSVIIEPVESLDSTTRETIMKIKSDLKNHLAHVNHLMQDNNKTMAGVYLMNVMKNFKMDSKHVPYVYNDLLPLLEKVIQSIAQAWHFDTPEWRLNLQEKQSETSQMLVDIIKKNHPSIFSSIDQSVATDTTETSTMHSNDSGIGMVMTDEVVKNIMNSTPWSNYISHSILAQFDIQKHLLLFFGEAIKEKNDSAVTLNMSIIVGYCYSILFNEPLMMSEAMTEKTILLKMWQTVHEKFESLLKQQSTPIILDWSTDLPINVKSCMNLCRIIFNFNARNESSYAMVESQLNELLKTDPNNPYILYFHCLVLEKKAKFLMMKDFDTNVYKIEQALQSAFSLVEKLENILKEQTPPQTRKDQLPYLTSGFTPFLPTPLRKAQLYSMQIDLFSRSQLAAKIQSAVKSMLLELGKLEKLLFPRNPLLLTNHMLNQVLFLKSRAYFYARNAEACCEAFETLFTLRFLFEEHEPNVVKAASFYVAGMHMLKRLPEAAPKLEQLAKEDPSNAELKFLQLTIRDFSLQNSYVSKNDFTSLIREYQELLHQVQEKTKNVKSNSVHNDNHNSHNDSSKPTTLTAVDPEKKTKKTATSALEQKILLRLQQLYQVGSDRMNSSSPP
ncbi:hypothetical protein C9374_012201 [Naegleria lovaniensis]|uniref:Uncharacterized protein n=1 Tax=Naegleria lovaniensis TaxID=51637 RepID=A0AA88G7N9_NAELO|nr:uncharacterized protein C9374_012201 [Naegleria lovaniensis]KAG2373335.1 hypothetical protein C9374_012201 [Naegleria lovaniensis]